jgi:hypothetical protein
MRHIAVIVSGAGETASHQSVATSVPVIVVGCSAMPPEFSNPEAGAAVAWILIGVSVAGMMMTVINLRNAGLWLLRIRGRRAGGVVSEIEIVTGPNGEVLRRPVIAFTTEDGRDVVGSPVLFRARMRLRKGSAVRISYARRRPTRMVVHGYDFRLREPIYAAAGLAITVGIVTTFMPR